MRAFLLTCVVAALSISGLAAAAGGGPSDQGKALFKQDCSSCHTVGGGDGVGPDLNGVVVKNGASAVSNFIADPAKAIASGNPQITALVTKFHGLKMPNLGLTSSQVSGLVAYLKAAGQAAPTSPPTSPAPKPAPGAAGAGRNLFTGATQLSHGGAACISCHSIVGLGTLGGGQLGPDLTRASAKYGGAKGLASVLSAIAFPRMVPVYRDHPLTRSEQVDLATFLASSPAAASPADHTPLIVVLGLGVTAALLALALVVWPRRRLVVRKRIAPTSTVRRA